MVVTNTSIAIDMRFLLTMLSLVTHKVAKLLFLHKISLAVVPFWCVFIGTAIAILLYVIDVSVREFAIDCRVIEPIISSH